MKNIIFIGLALMLLNGCELVPTVFNVPVSVWNNFTSVEKQYAIENYNRQKAIEAQHKPNIFRDFEPHYYHECPPVSIRQMPRFN